MTNYHLTVECRGPEYTGNRPLGWFVQTGEVKHGYLVDLVNGHSSQEEALKAAREALTFKP